MTSSRAGEEALNLNSQVQAKIGPMLKAVDDLCAAEGLRYFLIGGTLIGAVRHHGFIPWDDDIDIGMPRADYERFLEVSSKLPAPYEVSHSESDRTYIWPFAKCYDTSTTVTEDLYVPFTRGVWLDIFPLDGVFAPGLPRRLHIALTEILKKLIRLQKGAFYRSSAGSGLKRGLVYLSHSILRLLPEASLTKLFFAMCKLRDFDGSRYIANLAGRYGWKEVCERAAFDSYTITTFETYAVRVPAGYDKYLSGVYGDYMRLPPESERLPDHSRLYIDLHRSYKDRTTYRSI